ncbi:MAG: ribonucleotide reductase, partial [archaeon]
MSYPSQIFQRRLNLKPYEYPDLLEYKDAIRQSYWVHDEFESEFNRDVQDYRVVLTPLEKD